MPADRIVRIVQVGNCWVAASAAAPACPPPPPPRPLCPRLLLHRRRGHRRAELTPEPRGRGADASSTCHRRGRRRRRESQTGEMPGGVRGRARRATRPTFQARPCSGWWSRERLRPQMTRREVDLWDRGRCGIIAGREDSLFWRADPQLARMWVVMTSRINSRGPKDNTADGETGLSGVDLGLTASSAVASLDVLNDGVWNKLAARR